MHFVLISRDAYHMADATDMPDVSTHILVLMLDLTPNNKPDTPQAQLFCKWFLWKNLPYSE